MHLHFITNDHLAIARNSQWLSARKPVWAVNETSK